jgi:hypothetical protein
MLHAQNLLLLFLCYHARASPHAALASARASFSAACASSPHPVCPGAPFVTAPASPAALPAAWSLADALTGTRRFPEAASLRERALRSAGGGELSALPSSWAALAHDLRHARRYPEALAALGEAQRAAGGDAAPAPLRATLLEFEAELLSCLGDRRALEALRAFARAARARQDGVPPRGAEGALQELALLDRAIHGGPPAEVVRALRLRRAAVVRGFLARGWATEAQLPAHYDPSLRAAPWWGEGEADFAAASVARAALVAAAPALRTEFAALRDAARLEPETECIVEPLWLEGARAPTAAAGGAPERGGWRVFTAQGPWHEERDASGCAAALAPAACALAAQLRARGLPVLRVGYSALAPGATLRPHFGPTNTALKLHLGLRVPVDAEGVGCAAITVGGATRRWEEDGVLMFDDSFLHNVTYPLRCGSGEERVVFQVLFSHPDAAAARGAAREL